ncbi:MAG: hypothetical protein ACKV2T_14445, partial [Kofleriaceae bacterium]
MPDDERTRRRVSDETKGRIADLASGWSVDPESDEPAPEPDPPRAKQRTMPPPPPRAKAPSVPPPVPPRRQGTTQPPPLPPQIGNKSGSVPAIGGAKSGGVPALGVTNKSGAMPAMPPGAPSAAPYVSRQETSQPVPRGEFDSSSGGSTEIERDKLRVAQHQATIKRDPVSVLLEIPEAPLTTVKETPVEVLLTESAQHGR